MWWKKRKRTKHGHSINGLLLLPFVHILYISHWHIRKSATYFVPNSYYFEWVIIKLFSFMCPTSFICYTISIVLPLSLVNVSIAFVLLYFFYYFPPSLLFSSLIRLDPFHPFLRNYCYLARIISLFSVRFYDSIFVFFFFFPVALPITAALRFGPCLHFNFLLFISYLNMYFGFFRF